MKKNLERFVQFLTQKIDFESQKLSGEFGILVRDMKMPQGSFLISGRSCSWDLMSNMKFEF